MVAFIKKLVVFVFVGLSVTFCKGNLNEAMYDYLLDDQTDTQQQPGYAKGDQKAEIIPNDKQDYQFFLKLHTIMTTKCGLSIVTFLFVIAFCEGYPYYPSYGSMADGGNPDTNVDMVHPVIDAYQMIQALPTNAQGFSRVNRGPFGLNKNGG
ncbi:unnamed protein product [Mytilus edulis]|uniref:Uncharacterized protein n=1 Tax=Mytilus edulis TaxID=6550 RepID=A0A8S3Q906_MYTED|nr:unnamed protein product [Mytilus edulis]